MKIVKAMTGNELYLGKQGENEVRQIRFPIAKWLDEFGQGGEFSVIHQRSTDKAPYPAQTEMDEDCVVWTITASDVEFSGKGKLELIYTIAGKIAKSAEWKTRTDSALGQTVEPPAPYQAWVEEVLEARDDVVDRIPSFEGKAGKYLRVMENEAGAEWSVVEGDFTDFDQLRNRPSYNGTVMTGATDIPEVKTDEWDSKASGDHNHDDRYYTEEEMEEKLEGKADAEDIPTRTSQLENDSGYITSASILEDYRTSAEQDVIDAKKANASEVYNKEEADELFAGKLDADNPVGTGSFGLNRASGTAVGENSFVEGSTNAATKGDSHAEGRGTSASGRRSHSEGYYTTASEDAAHAEGEYTEAGGWASHSEGIHTEATNKAQHVEGEYNYLDSSGGAAARGTYAHIVGNGTSTRRSNAYALDWNGNGKFAGDVYVGCGIDSSGGTKLITDAPSDGKTYARKDGGWVEYSPSEEKSYLSLRRMGDYLYEVTYDTLPEPTLTDIVPGMCSSFVQDGKLYRNLDWDYSKLASFHVVCPGYEGMAFLPGLNDGELDEDLLSNLPYVVVDGCNARGIRVSTHVLFNDWNWVGTGDMPLYSVPSYILQNIASLDNFETKLGHVLENLYATASLVEADYLLHFLVTDGTTTYCIAPHERTSGVYQVFDISSNPKLTNFRWVAEETVDRVNLQTRPTGVERWNAIPCDLSELRFTKAYEEPDHLSEFIGIEGTTKESTDEELTSIYNRARAAYLDRERDGTTWQTMHSVVYGPNGMEHLWVQENWGRDFGNIAFSVEERLTELERIVAELSTNNN